MASITIGGQVIDVPPLSFFQLETAWPHFQAAQATADPIMATGSYLSFLAAIMQPAHPEFANPDDLKRALLVKEISGVTTSVSDILIENEMLPKPGEPQPATEPEAGDLSPGIAPGSSAS